jgi:putative transposase
MRPAREHATSNGETYMVTSSTWGRRTLFSRDVWAKLLIDTLFHYRGTAYVLHEFVVMPDHIHVLLTPKTTLEKAVQFIKGGFSFRAKKELGSNSEIWQKGFSDHRIRDASDCRIHQIYIQQNPVRKHLCHSPEEYLYSSARPGFKPDPVPQGLKPLAQEELGTARLEGAPFQSNRSDGPAEGAGTTLPRKIPRSTAEGAPFQSKIESRRVDAAVKTAKNKTA